MHMKTLIPTGFLLLSMTGLRAQHATKSLSPWSLSASMGVSFPVGKFAGDNYYDSSQSLATKGLALNLQLGYRLNAHFGIGLLLTSQNNDVNNYAIEQSVDRASVGTVAVSGNGSWKIVKAMVGPAMDLPVGQGGKWNFTARIMAGGLKTAVPTTMLGTVTAYSGGGFGSSGGTVSSNSYSYASKMGLSWAFAYLGGAGLDYRIDSRWKFLVNVDYSAASVKLPYLFYRHNFSGTGPGGYSIGPGTTIPGPLPSNTLSLPLASVNATLGLEYRF
jgi:hypothetical protein